MAVNKEHAPVRAFEDWYVDYDIDVRDGCLQFRALAPAATSMHRMYLDYKREMDGRCHNMEKLELMADGEVVSPKPDLPNVSSGETAGIVRRMARNLVQHVPNLEVISQYDDESMHGILAKHILLTKIVGSDQYSNDMQQNLFASTKTAITLGFDCVLPCLVQQADNSWIMKYDTIHYRDVFPEPGATDVRQANDVFVRRYLTKGDIQQLIRDQVAGWDHSALRAMLKLQPSTPPREDQSNALQDKKRRMHASGYEIITYYSNTGEPFLTFEGRSKLLLRIEKNKHPLKWHPVFFLVLEKDSQQPLGKSQVELIYGRQEFQDLLHNGAMKMYYRNINPPLLGYGAINAVPNLSPGKYTAISNPNARIEPFEVQTQTLSQYPTISQGNLGAMVNLVGSADQQMATQAGNGMSATPQGVEAQQSLVDITTNNYQKAIESFFSRYCSYALTIFFAEMRGVKKLTPNAETRLALKNAGIPVEAFDENGSIPIDFDEMAIEYWVRCVPGSLVELEDEKQIRLLNSLFVPLSQAMPALGSMQDQGPIQRAAEAMQFIIEKQIELSGSSHSSAIKSIMTTGRTEQFNEYKQRADAFEGAIGGVLLEANSFQESAASTITALQEQVRLLAEGQMAMMEKLGVPMATSTPETNNPEPTNVQQTEPAGSVSIARA